ncbi:MAG: LytTR family DNA-binding domain-containing protein [Gammaproteobacteria bacterium]|nr:LytTR family DNA-binding domain-containing protein [Gammaproteobacteria bacterium]MBU1656226.1 LytTR family DNA-binding domain-containing protein [Gammaproteobacteria bacterium]MBU1959791.1 LytTR family DNA-binding domain-containing protein [Gammaproteobacteria bacterium]
MKILIADDEPLARTRLRSLLGDLGMGDSIVAEASDGREAVEFCRKGGVDLVLLDIRMPGMDGMAAARKLLELDRPPAVIFTTAYPERALDAFDHHAVDYLLKPVRSERLQQALAKARSLSRVQLQAIEERRDKELSGQSVCVRLRGDLHRIEMDQILYFRAESKYVVVRHRDGGALLDESLRSLEQRFAGRFMRIHRNALINRDYLGGLKREGGANPCVEIRGTDECLEVSRRYLPAVRLWFREGSETDR